MADQQTIEAYDNLAGKWAESQRSKASVAHEYLEKPAMYAKLPADLSGKAVLCIGCGSGEECAHIKSLGAERVVGIDISKGLIEQAKYAYPDCEFFVMDMERMDFPVESFDFAYSSLALHYAEHWQPILKNIFKFLKPGGKFLFSTQHPVRWGADVEKTEDGINVRMGYARHDDGSYEVFGDYLNARSITDSLRKGLKVTYFHKSISEMVQNVLQAGFELADLIEPKPLPQAYADKPDFKVHEKIPLFLIIECRKL